MQAYNGSMTSRLKINSLLLPLVSIGMLVMQLLDPSPIWKALLTAFGGAWLIAFVWVHSLKKNLRLEREVRFGWTQVGDKLEERFSLVNKGFISAPWLEVVDHSTLPGYSASRATSVEAKGSNTWQTTGICSRRGVYTLGGTTLKSSDPFGIYWVEVHHPASQSLVVMPPVIPLPGIEVSPAGWGGDGKPNPNSPEQTVNSATVHEYQQGEPWSRIHWRTTAKHRKLFTRMLDGAPSNEWWILLDADGSVQAGRDADSTLELGVILAASLMDRGLRAQRSVGFLASGESIVWRKAQFGEEHRLRIMRDLAMLQPGNQPLAEVLERAGPTFGQRTSLIIITPSIQPDWLNSLVKLTWKGIRPTVLLMDANSFGSDQKADALANLLTHMGIPRFILDRSLLARPEAHPGGQGQWQWRVTSFGKAVPVRPLGDMAWKKLG